MTRRTSCLAEDAGGAAWTRTAAIADMRFHFIHQLVNQTVVKPHQSKEQLRSARIDRFLTGKYTAIPAFVGIMALVFYLPSA